MWPVVISTFCGCTLPNTTANKNKWVLYKIHSPCLIDPTLCYEMFALFLNSISNIVISIPIIFRFHFYQDLNKDDEILMSEKPVALAIYSFVAGNENELTFDSGDTIELVSKKSEDWFVGRCNGNEGCFPASFVAVLKPLQSQPEPNSPKLADLEDNNKTALTSEVNVTSETSFTNEDGKNDSSNKITVADEVDLIQAVNQNVCGCFGIAIADFVGTVDGDLSFKNGQEIHIISSVNEDWFKGSLQDRTGIFPKSFVKIDNN